MNNTTVTQINRIERIAQARTAYYQALETCETAWKAYNLGVDDYYEGRITRPQLKQILNAASIAETVKTAAYAAWGAELEG